MHPGDYINLKMHTYKKIYQIICQLPLIESLLYSRHWLDILHESYSKQLLLPPSYRFKEIIVLCYMESHKIKTREHLFRAVWLIKPQLYPVHTLQQPDRWELDIISNSRASESKSITTTQMNPFTNLLLNNLRYVHVRNSQSNFTNQIKTKYKTLNE